MKKQLLIFFALIISAVAAQSQSTQNAIFFTENGEKFQVVLNGILQNGTPETNVKMTGLFADRYKVRILFENKALGYVDYNLFFPEKATEVTFNIKKNSKGEYIVRYMSEVPIAQAPPTAPNQTAVAYTTTPAVSTAVESSTTTIQQSSTTTTNGTPDNVNINIGMNMGEQGGGINMNVSGMDPTMNGAGTTTTTTTTTHSTTTTTTGVNNGGVIVEPTPPPTHVVYVNGYNGPIGCPIPMGSGDFDSFKSSVESKSFEDSKLTIAKQVLQNNCLTSSQVREVMKMFSFEDTRLQFAKFAYGHTYDIGNYYKVNDAFQFESSIDDLNQYVSGH